MGIKHSPTTGFYPTPMTGANDSIGTVTYPNGFILKWGKLNCAAGANAVTFATAFPNACFQAFPVVGELLGADEIVVSHTITAASFQLHNYHTATRVCRWWAIGC